MILKLLLGGAAHEQRQRFIREVLAPAESMPKQHVPGISCTGCCCVRFDLAVSWISKLGTQLGETTALSSPICFKFEAPFRVLAG